MLVMCPNCNRTGSVPDNAVGRQVRCSGCQQLFPASPTEVGIPVAELDPRQNEEEDGQNLEPVARQRSRLSVSRRNNGRRYQLVCSLNAADVALQTIIWIVLSAVTCGFVLPFFVYFFFKAIINATEIVETESRGQL
jgi:hypothetical protein